LKDYLAQDLTQLIYECQISRGVFLTQRDVSKIT
jgi:hypothetical protein